MTQIKIERIMKIGNETFERDDMVRINTNFSEEITEEITGRLDYIDEDKIIIDTSEKFQSSFKQVSPKHIINIDKNNCLLI